MKQSKALGPSEYIVDFNREVAFTLHYSDAKGSLIFVWEPGAGPKEVDLSLGALKDHKVVSDEEDRERLGLAFERTREFLINCGYRVRIVGNDPFAGFQS